MDIIIDEARKRDMKVWILDDSHFPSGYANGALKNKPNTLRRQSIYTKKIPVHAGKKVSVDIRKICKKLPTSMMWEIVKRQMNKGADIFDDDTVLDVSVHVKGEDKPISIPYHLQGNKLSVQIPANADMLYITILTRNAGIHRDYMNMMDEESCKVLIDTVYEAHYAHYKDDFDKTTQGFFSDEPELGNGIYFTNQVKVGNDFDIPWSRDLQQEMEATFGDDWKLYMPMLFDNHCDDKQVAYTRVKFMDSVTKLVKKCFSEQIGNWCQQHGVSYIGRVIEDNNQHCRTGSSLGHYFRGLAGQHMAGIDDFDG